MAALEPERLTEIRALVTELATSRTLPAGAAAPDLLRRCERALIDVLGDRDALVVDITEAAEELATWTGALR
ncbi:hypothetical protein [Streptomyces cyaneofuscatus]|uniref:hypothetical protein n=1 Tax=Streptomyces cyaneofuscatus TaxID=66883 RepID=UPI0036DAE810